MLKCLLIWAFLIETDILENKEDLNEVFDFGVIKRAWIKSFHYKNAVLMKHKRVDKTCRHHITGGV